MRGWSWWRDHITYRQKSYLQTRGSIKIWQEVSSFTARSAVPCAVARRAYQHQPQNFEEGTLVASCRVYFWSFKKTYFMFLFSLKRGCLKCNSFKISMNFRWCQKFKHKIHTHESPWQRISSWCSAMMIPTDSSYPTITMFFDDDTSMTMQRWRCATTTTRCNDVAW